MWETIIVNPFTNVLLLIYNFVGQNFGVAIIIFTILIRLVTHPLMAKQIKSTQALQQILKEEDDFIECFHGWRCCGSNSGRDESQPNPPLRGKDSPRRGIRTDSSLHDKRLRNSPLLLQFRDGAITLHIGNCLVNSSL